MSGVLLHGWNENLQPPETRRNSRKHNNEGLTLQTDGYAIDYFVVLSCEVTMCATVAESKEANFLKKGYQGCHDYFGKSKLSIDPFIHPYIFCQQQLKQISPESPLP